MSNVVRNVLAFVAGLVVGGGVNMALVTLGPVLIPPPPGVDMTTPEGLREGMPLLEARHFIMPFLAHALGTLAGAAVACRLAATSGTTLAYIIGVLFLAGGITAATMIPAPAWFIALDLIVAYLPMSWLAIQLTGGRTRRPARAS